MLCLSCFEGEYKTSTISKTVIIGGRETILHDIECEVCQSCGDTMFTHNQSLEIDKKRIALEFGLKPTLTPPQLRTLRKILNLSLDEISDTLHIGKNTYGRWERGEVAITPSMNLLVHNLIDQFPQARVNLFEKEMTEIIRKGRDRCYDASISLGEFVRCVIEMTKLLPETVSLRTSIEMNHLNRIMNNEISPERIPVPTSASLYTYFQLTSDIFRRLLINTYSLHMLKGKVSYVHTRKPQYNAANIQAAASKSLNKILEKYIKQGKESPAPDDDAVAMIDQYLTSVTDYLSREARQ